jgi:hypothetical protein
MPAAQAAGVLAGLVDDLAAVVGDDRVEDSTALGLATRALRAVRPRAPRPTDRYAALAELRTALAEGPRTSGRPPVGKPRTIRVPDELWAQVEAYARDHGVSESRAGCDLIEAGLKAT